MWVVVARIILRNRGYFLTALGLITIFMAFEARKISISYEFAPLLPEDDTTYIEYQDFKRQFGEDVNILVIGVQDSDFFEINKFNDWKNLGDSLANIDGVNGIVSISHSYNILKNTKTKKFDIKPIFQKSISTQSELDSLVNVLYSLPFYKGMLYNDSTKTYLLALTINKDLLNSRDRELLIADIEALTHQFEEKYKLHVRHSGLAYTRTLVTQKIRTELSLFVVLALLVSATILFLFFRSFKVVIFPILIVCIGVIWAIGSMVLFGYKITILTGLIPPLIIVIGIPNSVFLLNKYHQEYKTHGNKIKALQRVIHKIGNATFLTNLTTAAGFATFILTSSDILKEFGIVASLNIMGVFVLSILLIPIFFSFTSPPTNRQTRHLENRLVKNIVKYLVHFTINSRNVIYSVTAILLILGGIGISLMKNTGYILADVPKDDPIFLDLKFFEQNFNGVMPLEIVIDTKKKNGVYKLSTLKKIAKLQTELEKYPQLSSSFSIADAYKFLRQAYYNGKEKHYKLPSKQETGFILQYLSKNDSKNKLISSFIDSTKQITRISFKIADVGTDIMVQLNKNIHKDIDKIFPKDKFNVSLTGTSIVYFRGANYLIKNLFISLLLAIVVISLFMTWMFSSLRMTIISLIPNLIPLLLTAAIMGYFGIPIKPSTVLVFSIAFGISVDGSIHFLAKLRQELKQTEWDIGTSVISAINETGVSMIYTSVILFFGFGIFVASSFGGTVALGMLVSITLFIATLSNLLLLPSLLFSLEKSITKKSFKEPLLQILEEEEDIELDDLKF